MELLDRYLRAVRCCGCADLRTGGIILGCIGIFFCVLGISSNIIFVSMADAETVEQYYRKTYSTPESNIISSFLGLIVSGCFLYGILNNKSAFLLPYVILSIIGLILFLVGALIFTILSAGIALIVLIPFGVLYWHFTAVSYSLYKQINENENPTNNTTVTNETYVVPQFPGATAPQYPGAYTLPQYPDANTLPPYSGVNAVPQYISTTSNTVPLYPSTKTVPQDQTSKA